MFWAGKLPALFFALIFASTEIPQVIHQTIQAHGGKEEFYRMRDVQYRLITKDLVTGKAETSIEQYLFDGERSKGTPNDRLTRKTNYFRFALPFKLLDEGLIFKPAGGIKHFSVVDVYFEKGVGDTQDRFRLFINSKTKLIDQYVYTDQARKQESPILVRCKYSETSGIQIPVVRTYSTADWLGNSTGKPYLEETIDNVQFWNGFKSL